MKQFIYDMINMTEGQKLIKYWWLGPSIVLSVLICVIVFVLIEEHWRKRK